MQRLDFTEDWFSNNVEKWSKYLKPLKGKALNVLEIGCFEGRATKWLLENILKHEDSKITVIDTFSGSIEHRCGNFSHDFSNTEAIFDFNVWMPYRDRVIKIKNNSFNALIAFNRDYVNKTYDFVYIDGSHVAKDVLSDALLVWPMVKKGGIIIFDDYGWDNYKEKRMNPRMAVDMFIQLFGDEIEIIDIDYQAIIRKVVE